MMEQGTKEKVLLKLVAQIRKNSVRFTVGFFFFLNGNELHHISAEKMLKMIPLLYLAFFTVKRFVSCEIQNVYPSQE